jgi:hypothetical protein
MDTQRLSAVLLIAGFVALVLSFLLGPPGIAQTYQPPDPNRRIQIIEQYKTRWNISQSLIGLSLLLTTIGFFVLNTRLYTVANAWIPTLGASAFIFGVISGALFIYRQTTAPLSTYEGAYSIYQTLYYWLSLAGLLVFGVAFLQAGLPTWLGYLTVGTALVYGVVFLVTGSGFATPFLISLLSLVIAVILLWQKPLP